MVIVTVYLVHTTFGFFILDKESKVLAEHLFYSNVEDSFGEIVSINEGNPTAALQTMVDMVKEFGAENMIVDNPMLSRAVSSIDNIPVTVDLLSSEIKWFRDTQDNYLTEKGVVESSEEILRFRQEVSMKLAKATISAASEEKDLLVKHAIDAIGEIDTSINLVSMRLREWYALHFPSLSGLVEDHELFARIVSVCGNRPDYTDDLLSEAGTPENMRPQIISAISKDIGADLKPTDLIAMQTLAKSITNLHNVRKELEEYVSGIMKSIAPNITELVGPLVGARLISLAGSLLELARKPSSTVQIFGAEKALFRSLKTGADPPKHGVIFQVAEIHSAPYWQRGKIARALAGKLSIAARIDAYSKRNIGSSLREQFEIRVKEIQKQNPDAPPPKPPKKIMRPQPRSHRDRGGQRDRGKGGGRRR
ncbi:MAG: C/D box methylation guide ribonucleoprotein complex aNOP56 subunit [Candidatus Thorarchaeota archaeon]